MFELVIGLILGTAIFFSLMKVLLFLSREKKVTDKIVDASKEIAAGYEKLQRQVKIDSNDFQRNLERISAGDLEPFERATKDFSAKVGDGRKLERCATCEHVLHIDANYCRICGKMTPKAEIFERAKAQVLSASRLEAMPKVRKSVVLHHPVPGAKPQVVAIRDHFQIPESQIPADAKWFQDFTAEATRKLVTSIDNRIMEPYHNEVLKEHMIDEKTLVCQVCGWHENAIKAEHRKCTKYRTGPGYLDSGHDFNSLENRCQICGEYFTDIHKEMIWCPATDRMINLIKRNGKL